MLPEHTSTARTALSYIHRFDLKAIVTTNFDPYIRLLASADRYSAKVYPDLPLSTGLQKTLFYLHGYFGADDPNANIRKIVLGRKSFEEA